jgi:hypothetical protein
MDAVMANPMLKERNMPTSFHTRPTLSRGNSKMKAGIL